MVCGAARVHAAAGSLDPTFGNGGKVVTSITNCGTGVCNLDPVGAMLQPNDEIVVGLASGASAFAVGAVRYLSNGSLDSTFGRAGFAPAVAGIGTPNAVALQPDGKIIVAGETGGISFTVVRYNANGTVDTTFGNGGLARSSPLPGGTGVGEAVLVQTDGKILVAGTLLEGRLGTPQTALARFNSNGSPAQTFGSDGAVLTPSTIGADALAELSNDDILVVNHKAIVQFNPSGRLEPSVTSGAVAVSSPTGVFLPDGHYFDPETVSPFKHATEAEVFEFNPTGSIDTAFNNPMFTYIPGILHASAISTAFQSDNKVIVAGSQCGNNCADGLARLNTNGSLDSSFGRGGVVTTSFSGQDFGYDVILIQRTGNIVAVGGSEFPVTDAFSGLPNSQAELTLARYLAQ
jgi:uncharacterized delta-60 repeat protein